MANHRERQFHDAFGQATHVHDLPGQHEKRHSEQRKAVGTIDHVLRQDLRVKQVQMPHQRHAADEQCKRDGDADAHGDQQGAQEDGDGHDEVGALGCGLRARAQRRSPWGACGPVFSRAAVSSLSPTMTSSWSAKGTHRVRNRSRNKIAMPEPPISTPLA